MCQELEQVLFPILHYLLSNAKTGVGVGQRLTREREEIIKYDLNQKH